MADITIADLKFSSPFETVCVIACGALARELLYLREQGGLDHIKIQCLPAQLHLTPEKIPGAVRAAIHEAKEQFDTVLVAYGDCGTGGLLDVVLGEENVRRIEGAHCYAFFSGIEAFTEMEAQDLGSFYLTDFLARHFETMVIKPLGLDRYPQLRDDYFGHYNALVYLAQSHNSELEKKAQEAALRLGLSYRYIYTGYGLLADFVSGADKPGLPGKYEEERVSPAHGLM